ncbi:MAG: hypothetical protein KJO23_01925 [Bacteroidia bacterium]|nr:hypothetical protein [Bacteroidia bacterium]NNM24001.1 hypothetical protein [Flavobacteriaceae bacterium]
MKKLLSLFFALFFNLLLIAQVSQQETQALHDFYQATHGESWNQQWNLNDEVSTWPGVTVEHGHVTEIRMLFNNLTGELPASIGDLTKLEVLELSFNELSGSIPESIGSLEKLHVLALNSNNLVGNIPASIGAMKQLKQLHLSSNKLSGELPNTLDQMNKMEVFNVFDNALSGELPVTLATNRKLREFMVAENNFTNTAEISTILLRNSGGHLDLYDHMIINPSGKSVIAIETSDDDH